MTEVTSLTTVSPGEAEVTVAMRRLISRAGCLRRWKKFEAEAEVLAEVEKLRVVRRRLRADREVAEAERALAAAGLRVEDYVSTG